MPVHSYLVYPQTGKKKELVRQLNQIPECETVEATNNELVVLVTDTRSKTQEDRLQERLKLVPEIQNIALVFGQED